MHRPFDLPSLIASLPLVGGKRWQRSRRPGWRRRPRDCGDLSAALEGEKLLYRVADTGIGIAPDKIGSLFTEFKQTDATIASEYGGSGLGLSISKKFIEMHGGRIWVESELGKGSAFTFEIPLRVDA